MGLGVKKITESVIEDNRALTTIGEFQAVQHRDDQKTSNPDSVIDINDNNAIDNGGLYTALIASGGVLRIKTGYEKQARINADESLAFDSITTRLIKDQNITTAKIKNLAVTTDKLADKCVTTEKIANSAVTSIKIADNSIKNNHLNSPNADDSQRTVREYNIQNSSISTDKIKNLAVTFNKLSKDLQDRILKIESDIRSLQDRVTSLESNFERLEEELNNLKDLVTKEISRLDKLIKDMETRFEKLIENKIIDIDKRIANAVVHNGTRSVGKKHGGGSTELINLHCTGDIEGNRVFFMTYQDLAEAYMPGEHMEPGDIVAMREDGLVYKANAFDQCIVGVISDEFANCLGATIDEIENGYKVAVGTIGKVHVNVRGPVKLGQQIHVIGADIGIGNASWTTVNSIGKSLETIDCGLNEINKVLVQIRPM